MTTIEKTADLAGRVLIAALFLITGFGKIAGYAGTQAYMASQGVPGALSNQPAAPAQNTLS